MRNLTDLESAGVEGGTIMTTTVKTSTGYVIPSSITEHDRLAALVNSMFNPPRIG
jgi:hypothetical protein